MKIYLLEFLTHLIQKIILNNQHISHFNFKLLLIQIYMRELNNPTKAWYMLSVFNETIHKLVIQQRFLIYCMFQELYEKLIYIDRYSDHDQTKFRSIINFEVNNVEFFKLIQSSTKLVKEFWLIYMNDKLKNILNTEAINRKIMEMNLNFTKLQIFFNEIQKLYEENPNVFFLYCCYLKHIAMDYKNADIIVNLLMDYKNNRNKVKIFIDDEYYKMTNIEEIGLLKVSCNNLEVGKIKWCNQKSAEITGFSVAELLKMKINRIIPPIVSTKHNDYMKSFINTYKARFINNNRISFIIDSYNYLVPVILYIKVIPQIKHGIEICSLIHKVIDSTFILYKNPEILHDTKLCFALINYDGSIEAVDRNANILLGLPNFIREGWKINISIDKSKTNLFEMSSNLKDMISMNKFSSNININTKNFEEDYYNDENGLFVSIANKIKYLCILKRGEAEMMKQKEIGSNTQLNNLNSNQSLKKLNEFDGTNINLEENAYSSNIKTKLRKKNTLASATSNRLEKRSESLKENIVLSSRALPNIIAKEMKLRQIMTPETDYYEYRKIEEIMNNNNNNFPRIKAAEIKEFQNKIIDLTFKKHYLKCEVYSLTSMKGDLKLYLIKIYYQIPQLTEEYINNLYKDDKETNFNINITKAMEKDKTSDFSTDKEEESKNKNLFLFDKESQNKIITSKDDKNNNLKIPELGVNTYLNKTSDDIMSKNTPDNNEILNLTDLPANQKSNLLELNFEKKLKAPNTGELMKNEMKLQVTKNKQLEKITSIKESMLTVKIKKQSKKFNFLRYCFPLFAFFLLLVVIFNLTYEIITKDYIQPRINILSDLIVRRDLTINLILNSFYYLNIQNKIEVPKKFPNYSFDANKVLKSIYEDIIRIKQIQNSIEKRNTIVNSYAYDIVYFINFDNSNSNNYIFSLKLDVAYNKFISNLDKYYEMSSQINLNSDLYKKLEHRSYFSSDSFYLNEKSIEGDSNSSISANPLNQVELKFMNILNNGINLLRITNVEFIENLKNDLFDKFGETVYIYSVHFSSIGFIIIFCISITIVYFNAFLVQDEIFNIFSKVPNFEGVKILVMCDRFLKMISSIDNSEVYKKFYCKYIFLI